MPIVEKKIEETPKKKEPPPPLGKPKSELERKRRILKAFVIYFYDTQRQRIASGNRSKRYTLNLEKDDASVVSQYADNFAAIEKELEKKIKKFLKEFDIYEKFLKNIKGVGPIMAAVLISELDIEDSLAPPGYGIGHTGAYEKEGKIYRQRTVSQFWKYAGLAPVTIVDDKGVSRDVGSRKVAGQKINYSPFLKTKILGVLADCFIKLGSPYRKFYDEHKKLRKDSNWGVCDMQRHRDSIRHMMKCFLMDLFYAWRKLEDLPARLPYQIEKLGHSWAQVWHMKEHPCITLERASEKQEQEKEESKDDPLSKASI